MRWIGLSTVVLFGEKYDMASFILGMPLIYLAGAAFGYGYSLRIKTDVDFWRYQMLNSSYV